LLIFGFLGAPCVVIVVVFLGFVFVRLKRASGAQTKEKIAGKIPNFVFNSNQFKELNNRNQISIYYSMDSLFAVARQLLKAELAGLEARMTGTAGVRLSILPYTRSHLDILYRHLEFQFVSLNNLVFHPF